MGPRSGDGLQAPWGWWSGAAAAFLALSFSSDHYWDEYFYLFSVARHSPLDLVGLEATLADGIVPYGFFAAKIGFVSALWGLVALAGDGPQGLLGARLAFTALLLATAGALFKLLETLLPRREAAETAVVFLALPLPLYLGWKTLSETPALLFAILGAWQFAASLHARGRRAARHRGLAMLSLAASALCRAPGPLLLGGLLLGLLARSEPAVPRTRVLRVGLLVLMGQLLATTVAFAAVGISPIERLAGLVASVSERPPTPALRVYAVALFGQLCWIPALVACRPARLRERTWILVWFACTVVPFLLLGTYAEPRYLFLGLPPFAILVRAGLGDLAARWPQRAVPVFGTSLVALVLLNRLLLAPLMPVEIEEGPYRRLVDRLAGRYPSATFVTPWLTDYCYLALTFPERPVALALSESYGTGGVFTTEGFRRWVGAHRYVGDRAALLRQPRPWLYLGWQENPSVRRLADRLTALRLARLVPAPLRSGLLDHRTPSWIWRDHGLLRVPVDREGPYEAYELRLREDARSVRTTDLR